MRDHQRRGLPQARGAIEPQRPGEPLRIAGIIPVRNREEDDPQQFIVLHRDVGGGGARVGHRLEDPECWCCPMVVSQEDSRRPVYAERFRNFSRVN